MSGHTAEAVLQDSGFVFVLQLQDITAFFVFLCYILITMF